MDILYTGSLGCDSISKTSQTGHRLRSWTKTVATKVRGQSYTGTGKMGRQSNERKHETTGDISLESMRGASDVTLDTNRLQSDKKRQTGNH